MTTEAGVLKRVTTLPGMTVSDLKGMWRDLYDQEPPPHGKPFLIRKLAYRIQELSFGGLSETTELRMDAMAGGDQDPKSKKAQGGKKKRKKSNHPIPGTRLEREWKGKKHQVTVLDDGFEYQDRKFKSLSAIAKKITGTQWSGPVFFGLKKNGGDK